MIYKSTHLNKMTLIESLVMRRMLVLISDPNTDQNPSFQHSISIPFRDLFFGSLLSFFPDRKNSVNTYTSVGSCS